MIKKTIVRHNFIYLDGSLIYPGIWVETWALMAGTGSWMLIGFEPHKEARA